jgi:hypothetical protein
MKRTKYIHVGQYVAEIDVELSESGNKGEWGPYLSLEDAYRLDDIRELLKSGDVAQASRKARLYTLTPIAESN